MRIVHAHERLASGGQLGFIGKMHAFADIHVRFRTFADNVRKRR